jgi:Zn-dependent M28 family amino/carboxypeptidase
MTAAAKAVDGGALRSHVQVLAGDIGERNVFRPRALAAAADYIEAVWRHQGYDVTPQIYEVHGVRCANLEVTRPGTAPTEGSLLLGAHYDSIMGGPGANDNGSGVAALLELSRLFAGVTPKMSVRFVAFVNEEPPFFMSGQQGSMVYARAARARGDDIRLMVALETIGCYCDAPGSQRYPPLFRLFYPKSGNFLAFVSDFGSRRHMRHVAAAFRAGSDFPLEHVATFAFVPGVNWSDHRSFWVNGYPAFMVTDTAFYRYRYYHTAEDTPDRLSYSGLARATEGLYRAFETVASGGLVWSARTGLPRVRLPGSVD